MAGEPEVARELYEANQRAADAFNRGDYAGIASFYTKDATFLAPDRSIARGRNAVAATYADIAASGVRHISFSSVDIEDHGDLVIELGLAIMSDGSSAPTRRYYLIVWRREGDGQLRLHWDAPASSLVDAR